MMKKTIIIALVFALAFFCLASCSPFSSLGLGNNTDESDENNMNSQNDTSRPGDSVKMTAVIKEIDDKIAVDVTESEYTSGVHLVITAPSTEYFDKNGNNISRSDLNVGDTVEILYGGQVMMSYPPQIVAARISVVG